MISVSHLRKVYQETPAVDDISFNINKGEIVGLLGPNGAGKTTTMRIITGYLPKTSGEVSINSIDIEDDPLMAKKAIGYLPENTPLYDDMKVSEFLSFVADLRQLSTSQKKTRIHELVNTLGLHDRLNQEIGHLSKGYRQRVGLAQALLHDPEVLILDEPTSGLDPNQTMEIRSLIKSLGKKKTVIFSTHILSEAEATCDRVMIIHKGKIVASGTSGELRAQHKSKAMVTVTVEGSGDGLRRRLEEIPGVLRVMRQDTAAQGFTTFEIETESEKDLRREITQSVVQAGFGLVEIKREEKSLEEVFAALTVN